MSTIKDQKKQEAGRMAGGRAPLVNAIRFPSLDPLIQAMPSLKPAVEKINFEIEEWRKSLNLRVGGQGAESVSSIPPSVQPSITPPTVTIPPPIVIPPGTTPLTAAQTATLPPGATASAAQASAAPPLTVAEVVSMGLVCDVWISLRTDGRDGTGCLSDPFNGSTPDKLDAILRSIPINSAVNFLPGLFLTRGYQYQNILRRWMPKTGWKIKGSGIDVTTLKLVEPASDNYPHWIIGIDSNLTCDSCSVEDLTLDCNFAGLRPNTATPALMAGACILYGSDVIIRRVRAINFGTNIAAECFVLGTGGSEGSNQLIAECIVENPAYFGSGGVTCIQGSGTNSETAGDWGRKVVIRDNYIDGLMPNGTTLLPGAGIGLGGAIHQVVTRNYIRNCNTGGPYADTWAYHTSEVDHNYYDNVVTGIHFSIEQNSFSGCDQWTMLRTFIHDNVILLNGQFIPFGITVNGGQNIDHIPPPYRITDVVEIRRNFIGMRLDLDSSSAYGIGVLVAATAIIEDNTFSRLVGGVPEQMIRTFRCGAIKTSRNRTTIGQKVRTYNFPNGFDGGGDGLISDEGDREHHVPLFFSNTPLAF